MRNDDETPISFDEDHVELPDDVKIPSKPPSAVPDIHDLRGPSPLVGTSTVAAAPEAAAGFNKLRSGDLSHLKSFRLFKGQDGFGFSVQSGQVSTGVSVKGVKDGGVAHKAGVQVLLSLGLRF